MSCAMTIRSDRKVLKPRARDWGIPFDGTPGALNAITDVAGVEVGISTIIRGEGKLVVGLGPGAYRRHCDCAARQARCGACFCWILRTQR